MRKRSLSDAQIGWRENLSRRILAGRAEPLSEPAEQGSSQRVGLRPTTVVRKEMV